VAEELEGGGDAEALADRLAYHWSHATGPRARELAAAWSLRAARAAVAGLGLEQAVVGFRRALAGSDSDRVAVLLELGEAERLSGDLTAARATYLEAGALAGATGRTQELALAALGLGGGVAGLEVQVSDERQVGLLRQADAALPPGDDVLRAAVRGRLSLALAEIGSLVERVRLAEEAVAMATRVGDGRVEAAVLAAYCDAVAGPDFVAVRLTSAERILRLAESAGDRVGALLARRLRLVAHLEAGDFAAADAEFDAYRRTAGTLGIPLYLWLPEVWRGMRALLAGDVEAAFGHAEDAEAVGARAGSENAAAMVFTLRLYAHRARGTATQFAAEARQVLTRVPLPDRPTYQAAISLLLLEAGDPTLASATLWRFLDTSPEEMVKDAEWLEAHWALAEIATALEDPEAATRLFDTLRPYEGLWAVDGIGGAIAGTIAQQLGRLAAFLGRRSQAGAYLHAALDQYLAAGALLLAQRWRRPWPDSVRPATPPGHPSIWKRDCAARVGCGSSNGAAGAAWSPTRRACGISPCSWLGRVGRCPRSTWSRHQVGRSRPGATSDRSSTPPHDGPTAPASPSLSRRSMRRRRTRTSAAPNGCAPSSR
jgi:hypothetical protein